MIIVYIAGPYRAKTTWGIECNIHRARQVGADVAQVGCMPLIPHGNTEHFDGLQPDAFWLAGTLELLRRSDAVVVVDGWKNSEGAQKEVAAAHKLGLPVFEGAEALRGWLKDMGEMGLNPWVRL
jgi:hypothetical protein